MTFFEALGMYHFFREQAELHVKVLESAIHGLQCFTESGRDDFRKLNFDSALNLLAIAEKEAKEVREAIMEANRAARYCNQPELMTRG